MRAWPRRRAGSGRRRRRATPWVRRRLTPRLPNSFPTSTFSIVHSLRTALRLWRVVGCAACVAASTFGFYLAGIDLRQNSEVHERTVGELFEMACTASNYAGLGEAARVALLREELKTARLLSSPFLRYSAETASELTILREAAEAHRRYGKAAVPNYVISKTNGVSDLLEVALLLKEAGLLRP